jgi:hypothetical protein
MQSKKNPQVARNLLFRPSLSGPAAGLQARLRPCGMAVAHPATLEPTAQAERLPLSGDRYIAYHRRNHAANDLNEKGT